MLVLWLLFLIGMSTIGLVMFSAFSNQKAKQYLPPIGSFANLNGTKLHYLDQGQGPAILMIHGLAGNLHNFTYGLASPLAQNFRVICVDRPGCGYSMRASDADSSLEAQANTLAHLLEHLGIDSAVLVGHSLGGAISLAMAQQHPQKVKALALIAPLTKLPEETARVFKPLDIASPFARQLIGWTLAVPGTIYRMKASLKVIFGPEKAPADFAIRGGGILSLQPRNFITASSDLQHAKTSMPDIEAGYASMTTPIHVLYGREDRVLSCKDNGEDLVHHIRGVQLTLVTGGHMLPVTQVEKTLQFIQEAAGNATGRAS